MKGIILAGGSGTRLFPITKGVSKQLLPIYNKPMIYYPLSVLMLAEIREVLIITTPEDQNSFKKVLGDGTSLGMILSYAVQEKPNGLAEAFIIGERFIGEDNVCLILGDNIFWGHGFSPILKRASGLKEGARLFGYQVHNPKDFGVAEFDNDYNILSIEEKPENPKSEFAVTGLYFYDNTVIEKAKNVKPSKRGEIEITAINQMYLNDNNIKLELLGRGFAWLDTGTCENLHAASSFVEAIEKRQGFMIGCIEEIAWRNNWISDAIVELRAKELGKNEYGKYLKNLLKLGKI